VAVLRKQRPKHKRRFLTELKELSPAKPVTVWQRLRKLWGGFLRHVEVLATLFISVLTFFYVRTTHEQLKVINSQLEAAYLDQRPWAAAPKLILSAEPVAKARYKITFHVVNTGRTPALALFAQADAYIADAPRIPQPLAPSAPAIAEAERAIVPPNYDQDIAVPGIETDRRLITAYNKGRLKLYVQGIIQYEDGSGEKHWTTVCRYHVHGTKPDDFDYCAGNDMDTKGKSLPYP
jgi:hypothetical protein